MTRYRGAGIRLDLAAQPLDVHIEGLGVPHIVRAPHPVNQLAAGEHLAGVAQQHFQELEFLQRERHLFAVDADHMPLHVHAHRAGMHRAGHQLLGLALAAQHGPDPGDQLTGGVGLGHVVVGAELQPHHLVDLRVLGRQHDDGDSWSAAADACTPPCRSCPAAAGPAAPGRRRCAQIPRWRPGRCPPPEPRSLPCPAGGQGVADGLLVLDNQNSAQAVSSLLMGACGVTSYGSGFWDEPWPRTRGRAAACRALGTRRPGLQVGEGGR